MKRIALAAILCVSAQLAAQASAASIGATNPKVRAITGFVRLDRGTYEKQIAETLLVLRKAKSEFEAAGYQVETIRIDHAAAGRTRRRRQRKRGARVSYSSRPALRERRLSSQRRPGHDARHRRSRDHAPAGARSLDAAEHRGQHHHRRRAGHSLEDDSSHVGTGEVCQRAQPPQPGNVQLHRNRNAQAAVTLFPWLLPHRCRTAICHWFRRRQRGCRRFHSATKETPKLRSPTLPRRSPNMPP